MIHHFFKKLNMKQKLLIFSVLIFVLFVQFSCTHQHSKIRSVEDLNGHKIGVLLGSIQDLYVTQYFPSSEIVRVEHLPDLTLSLKNDKCDAIVIHHTEGVLFLEKNPDFAYLEENLSSSSVSAAFPKEDKQQLLKRFNEFCSELKQSKLYDEIYERWFNQVEMAVMPPSKTQAKTVSYALELPAIHSLLIIIKMENLSDLKWN